MCSVSSCWLRSGVGASVFSNSSPLVRWATAALAYRTPSARHVRSGHPGTRVLVLSGYPERQYALNVLRAGASGYIAKDCAPEELLKAVRMVLQGRRYVSDSLAELLLLDLDQADKPLHSLLSDREFQIFGKLAAGHGVSEIGRELCLSVKTVSTYRTRILEKMRMKSNADLTSYALRNEIIQ